MAGLRKGSEKVKVGRTNHVGQERSNWTYCQYKGHLTHIKETHKDCHMNLGQYFKIGHWLDRYGWTNCRGLDNCPKALYHWTISKSNQVKVGRTNHVGQVRSNWTYCQYKGHLTI